MGYVVKKYCMFEIDQSIMMLDIISKMLNLKQYIHYKKNIQALLVSFPPSLSIYIYNVVLCIIILCHIFYHVSDKDSIMRNYKI